MPLERRQIMFYLTEVQSDLLKRGNPLNYDGVPDVGNYKINMLVHSSERHRFLQESKSWFENIKNVSGDTVSNMNGLFIKSIRTDMSFTKPRVLLTFINDQMLLEIIVRKCIESGIMIPAAPEKRFITENMMLGVSFEINSVNLCL